MPTAVRKTSPAPRPDELFRYLTLYRVLVCTSCRYAIQPKAIARHLKDIHRIKRADREPFMQHVEKFELADHEAVMRQTPGEFPVPLLPVQSGLQCTSAHCAYLCVTEKRMKHHWVSIHERQGLAECDWQPVRIQTFFKGNLLRYFTGARPGKSDKKIATDIDRPYSSEEWKEHISGGSVSLTPTPTTSPTAALNEQDDMILHHFVTHTCLTLAPDENTQHMWRVIVPQIAHQHEYLMNALLACTALHMAHLNPDQRLKLTIKARSYYDQAMSLFLTLISKVESATGDAILVFARVIGIIALALDERSLGLGDKGDELPGWLFFIKSGCTMLCHVWGELGTGPVRCLAQSWEIVAETAKFPDQSLLDYLLAIPPVDWTEEVRVPYTDSARALACTFSSMYRLDEKTTTLDVIHFWPVQNSVEFVDLLGNSHPGALILLAYYCIVLHRVGTRTWYLGGGGATLLSTVVKRLDVTWHRYIEWPLREIELSPATEKMFDELPIESLTLSGNIVSSVG